MSRVATLLHILFPVGVRFLKNGITSDATNVVLSLLPLSLLLPSGIVAGMVTSDEVGEHVARHALYASSFLVSATAVRWDVIMGAWEEEDWAQPFTLYFAVGSVTLWWFVVAHVMENRRLFGYTYTHQGDVVVLPFTLIAITSFANDVPDEAYRFSRSIVFAVPIRVAWSTIMLIAYTGFALSRTTTLSNEAYNTVMMIGFVVSTTQLLFLEVRSSPAFYIAATFVLALYAQTCNRPNDPPTLYEGRTLGTCVVAALVGGLGGGSVLALRFGTLSSLVVCGYVSVMSALAVRTVCGKKWIGPATLVSCLQTCAIFVFLNEASLREVDVAAIACTYFVTFCCVAVLVSAVYDPNYVPSTPPSIEGDMPQLRASVCSWSGFARYLDRIPFGFDPRVYDDSLKWLVPFFDKVDENCPSDFVGVWWMEHNTFPMELITVHRRRWNEEGTKALFWNGRDITFHNSFSGSVMDLLGHLTFTEMTVVDRRWIRTNSYKTPLKLWTSTFWLYRVDKDLMIRIVYDDEGRVVWRYNMKRIATGPRAPTRHMRDFLVSQGGRTFRGWLS